MVWSSVEDIWDYCIFPVVYSITLRCLDKENSAQKGQAFFNSFSEWEKQRSFIFVFN